MSDAVKWALLATAAILIIALIVALPFVEFIDFASFSESLNTIVNYAGNALYNARCLINNFLSPVGRLILSGILIWLFGKWALKVAINVVVWVYHFIFK
ncbi:MAG: hypothetical protein E7521_08600 [Ruminococcaceae bacterium]|nr:hypothetical protein [Oscillospiraceae bacterium]